MLKLLLVLTLSSIILSAAEQKPRRPKLFFISTSSTTSTLKTLSVCYTTNNTFTTTACPGRRKRALNMNAGDVEDEQLNQMAPTQRLEEDDEEEFEEAEEKLEGSEIESGKDEETDRDGKFLLYWKTTTLTSTSTSYTVTHSLKNLECTPSGFNLAACG